MGIKISIQQDEGTDVVREFSSQLPMDTTWDRVLEEAIWLLKGMTYELPDTDDLMIAIQKVHARSLDFPRGSDAASGL